MRVYLLVVFIVLGVIPLTLFTYILLNTYEDKAISNRRAELENQGYMLSNMLYSRGYLTTGEDTEVDSEVSRLSDIYRGRIIIVNSSLNIVKDTYSLEEGKYLISEDVIQCLQGTGTKYLHDRETQYIKLTYPVTHNDSYEFFY